MDGWPGHRQLCADRAVARSLRPLDRYARTARADRTCEREAGETSEIVGGFDDTPATVGSGRAFDFVPF